MSHASFTMSLIACTLCSQGVVWAQHGQATQSESTAPLSPATKSQIRPAAGSVPCGPACLAIICRLLGIGIENDALASIVDERGESSFYDLERYLDSKGVHTLAVQTTPAQLPSLGCMCVLQVRVAPTPGEEAGSHFVVFLPGGATGHSYVLDPIASGALIPARMDLLVNRWTGKALFVSKAPISRKPSVYIHAFPGLVAGAALGVVLCKMIGSRSSVRGSSPATTHEALRSATE